MADIDPHLDTRATIIGRLGEIEALKAIARTGLRHLLRQADYLASTADRARHEGISIREMHRRGVANLIDNLDAEAGSLLVKLREFGRQQNDG